MGLTVPQWSVLQSGSQMIVTAIFEAILYFASFINVLFSIRTVSNRTDLVKEANKKVIVAKKR